MTDDGMPVTEHLDRIAHEAGYQVMDATNGILGIVFNRETVSDARLSMLTPEDVNALYDAFIGPAVDALEDYLLTTT